MRSNRVVPMLVDEFNSFTRPLYRNGVVLSKDDTASTREVYIQWMILLCDLGVLSLDCDKRVVRHIVSDLMSADIMGPLNAFAEALSRFLRNESGFKAQIKLVSPHLWRFLRPYWEKHGTGQIDATRILIQVCAFPGRLSLRDIDLSDESIKDYLLTESNITGDEVKNSYIPHLASIVQRWVRRIDISEMIPKHGPGGVAGHGRTSLETKYRDLSHDVLLRYAFDGPHKLSMRSSLDRVSQTIFVAKNYKSFRTISMEPTTLMYYQQGIWRSINSLVSRSPYLRNRIGFKDQERNRLLAQEGSLLRNYATIDLSAASDSVSWELVKAVFGKTRLYRYILATRSRYTLLPNGQYLLMKKFAPMGSALCFPIETIIFASVCEFITREHGFSGDYSVFGDDIIVPTPCVDDVILVLQQLGFRVNNSKSFTDPTSPFRESCGGEYWNGLEVTPFRIARNFTSKVGHERYVSLVDAMNECQSRGYNNLRYYYQILTPDDIVLYYHPRSVHSSEPTNYHTDRRWNEDLQRFECRVSSLVSVRNRGSVDESTRYQHWLSSTHGRSSYVDKIRHWLKDPKGPWPDDVSFQSDIARSAMELRKSWEEISITTDLSFNLLSKDVRNL